MNFALSSASSSIPNVGFNFDTSDICGGTLLVFALKIKRAWVYYLHMMAFGLLSLILIVVYKAYLSPSKMWISCLASADNYLKCLDVLNGLHNVGKKLLKMSTLVHRKALTKNCDHGSWHVFWGKAPLPKNAPVSKKNLGIKLH